MSDRSKPASFTPSSSTRGRPLSFVIGAAVLGWMALGLSAAQDPLEKKAAQEYVNPLKGKPEDLHKLALVGPDANQFVTLEPEGLRIRLPAGIVGEGQMHGVNSGMIAKGDFEITASFEVLREPGLGEAGNIGTKVHLLVTATNPASDLAGFSRAVNAKGPAKYTAWRNLWDDATRKHKQKFKGFDAKGTKWRFRLARTGSTLSYYLAEEGDADFRLLQQHDYVEDDVKDIRVVAQTGGPLAALDVRVTDLRIRAESLPNLEVAEAEAEQAAMPPPAPRERKLWLAAGLGVGLLLALGLVMWRSSRARNAGAAGNVSVGSDAAQTMPCSGCGKILRVRSELVGKRFKCPRCGQVLQGSGSSEGAPAE